MSDQPPHTLPPRVINLFFAIGLLSALAFRMLIIFTHLRPELVRPVWYAGIIGYILFFLYRYVISEKRKKAILRYRLIEKIQYGGELTAEERGVVVYLLSSISKSRENWNYLFIFVLSIAAVVLDLVLSARG